jgi:hypothetical protein
VAEISKDRGISCIVECKIKSPLNSSSSNSKYKHDQPNAIINSEEKKKEMRTKWSTIAGHLP